MGTTMQRAHRSAHADRAPMSAALVDHDLTLRAVGAFRASAPSVDQLAREKGVSSSRMSHLLNDDAASNPFAAALRELYWAARGRKTNPFPMLVEVHAVTLEACFATKPTDWLERRYHELRNHEHDLEAHENRTGQQRDRHAWRLALLNEAAAQVELAAIDAELERRGRNPLLEV